MLGGVFCGIWCDGEYTLVPSRIKIPEFLGKRNIPRDYRGMRHIPGGWGGIRTPGGVAPTTVFKTVAIDRSATHPELHHTAGLSNLRFCSLAAPGGAAHHSFALDCADACLADSYARPSQSTAATTLPELHHTAGLSNLRRGLKTLAIIQCLERIVNLSVMLIIILANPDARVIIITGEAT